MNPTQRAKLAEAARKATPGPWERVGGGIDQQSIAGYGVVIGLETRYSFGSSHDVLDTKTDDMDFIAACDPQSILSLLALVEAGERCGEAIHNVLGMAEGSANAIAYQLEQEEAGNIPKHTITKTAMAVWLRAHATDLKALEVALAAYAKETM